MRSASSHFAIAAKRAGVDALAITGACDEPAVVFVDGTGADEPRGLVAAGGPALGSAAPREAEDRIRAEHGTDWQVASIGPAGERLIPFATLSHDGRHAGRGGPGGGPGRQADQGRRRPGRPPPHPVADPGATVALARRLSALSFGPATEKYRELGTVANLLVFNRFDTLPTRNFRVGPVRGGRAARRRGPRPGPADRADLVRRVHDRLRAHLRRRNRSGGGVRLEYESLFALGPLCGVDDPRMRPPRPHGRATTRESTRSRPAARSPS